MRKAKPPVLRPHEEEDILKDIIGKAKRGEPVLREDVINKVIQFIRSDMRKNPFRDGQPGDKWFSLFRRRHNSYFTQLTPEQRMTVEKVGFTEKVMNTVVYSNGRVRPHTSFITGSPSTLGIPVIRKVRPKNSSTPSETSTPKQNTSGVALFPMQTETPSPMSEESSNTTGTDDGDSKSQEGMNDTNDFQPGSKLEVMDFNDKWYPVKVVEVDYEEGEVLVHYEKWSDRYDEWVSMDSNRIRRPSQANSPSSKKVFEENEKVIAVWAYNHKYPATVKQVLPNDKYEVLFIDGYAKILRGCKLFKASEEDLKNCKVPPPKKPAPPMGADPLDPDLGPKEERRLKKRRLDVLESYLPHKRQRSEQRHSSPEPSPQPVPSTSESSATPKLMRSQLTTLKPRVKIEEDSDDEDSIWPDCESRKPKTGESCHPKIVIRRKPKRKKKVFDESTYKYQGPKYRLGLEEDSERWNTEIPEGVSPVQIRDNEGFYRESVIIPDKKLPRGWTKHTMRRKNGAKWDVFLTNPEGRKFRSRNELRSYFAELKQPFPEENFDFMVGRKMEMIRSQEESRKKSLQESLSKKSSLVYRITDGERQSESKNSSEEPVVDVKKTNTLLSKRRRLQVENSLEKLAADLKKTLSKGRRLQDDEDGNSEKSTRDSSAFSNLASPPFPLTEARTPNGGFTCCGKTFRKENIFQMHVRHYHPEYCNVFSYTPTVAELAYARTVLNPLEHSRVKAMATKKSLKPVNQYEADRKALTDLAPASAETPKKNTQEEEPVEIKLEKEEPLSFIEVEMKEEPVFVDEDVEGDGFTEEYADTVVPKEEKNILLEDKDTTDNVHTIKTVMHMKHYHPEYSNVFWHTPTVPGFGDARTGGKLLEDSGVEVMALKNSFLELVNEYETLTDLAPASAETLKQEEEPVQIKEEPLSSLEVKIKEEPVSVEEDVGGDDVTEDYIHTVITKEEEKIPIEYKDTTENDPTKKTIVEPLTPVEEIKVEIEEM